MPKLILILLLGSLVWGNIGKVTAMRGDVKITRGIALYQAHMGLEIEEGDTFFTTKRASMQITFADNSVITLGQDTVFKVQEYLYNESNTTDKAQFKLHKGFFKSITGRIGKVAPKNYTIKTKNSTIGVRGTQIIGSSDDKKESIACTDGAITVATGTKKVVAKANEAVEIKLDPRIVYTVASPTDVMVIAQVKAGIKKADDPEVKRRPQSEVTVAIAPQAQKVLKKQGIDPQTILEKPDVTLQEAKPLDTKTKQTLDKGFVTNTQSFKSEKVLAQEIKAFEQKVLEEKTQTLAPKTVEPQESKKEPQAPQEEPKVQTPPPAPSPAKPAKPFLPKSHTYRTIDEANRHWDRFEQMQRLNNLHSMTGRY